MDILLQVCIAIGSFVLGAAVAVMATRKGSDAQAKSPATSTQNEPASVQKQKETNEQNRKLVEKASNSLLGILKQLAIAVKNLDGAASRSSNNLSTVRGRLDELPEDSANVQEYQKLIIREIDKIMHDNSELRTELSKSHQELAKQKKVIDVLQHEVHTDHLTQVGNRLSFDECIDQCFTRFKATKNTFCLLLADVDHFKKINDTHGHVIGDRVLEAMANKLSLCLRSSDYIARYGGEEFVILLEKTDLKFACKIAEDLRNAIETTVFNVEDKKLRLTISIGCAQSLPEDDRANLITRADAEMYNAKNAGRNRVYPRLHED